MRRILAVVLFLALVLTGALYYVPGPVEAAERERWESIRAQALADLPADIDAAENPVQVLAEHAEWFQHFNEEERTALVLARGIDGLNGWPLR